MICDPCKTRADKGTALATAKGRPLARSGCGEPCGDVGCSCQHKGRVVTMTIVPHGPAAQALPPMGPRGTLDLVTTTDPKGTA